MPGYGYYRQDPDNIFHLAENQTLALVTIPGCKRVSYNSCLIILRQVIFYFLRLCPLVLREA